MSQQQTPHNAPYNGEKSKADTGPNFNHDKIVVDMALLRQRKVASARYILKSNPMSQAYETQKHQEAAWNVTSVSNIASTPAPHAEEMNTHTGDQTITPKFTAIGDEVAEGLRLMADTARASLTSLHEESRDA